MLNLTSRCKNRIFCRQLCQVRNLSELFDIQDPKNTGKKITMKIGRDLMKKLQQPGLEEMQLIFERYGHDLRIVGGPVRDLLMGLTPHDIDFATTATPSEMRSFFEKENVKIVNNRGERHGTITARVRDCNFECTTLRLHKRTDGRHAEVEFITDWEMDAQRRDLTINSMYLAFDGTVYDYCNGIEHLKNKRVTFVGDHSKRIEEDYLRILRYFRFFGKISDSGVHEEDVIESIKKNVQGLCQISGERIFMELKSIVKGKLGNEMIVKMKECGIFPYIGLSEKFNLHNFNNVYNSCTIDDVKAVSLLTAGFLCEEDANNFIQRVRCSKKERSAIFFILQNGNKDISDEVMMSLLIDLKYKQNVNESESHQLVKELMAHKGVKLDIPLLPVLPFNGNNLRTVNNKSRKQVMGKLIDIWKNSNYTMTKEELLDYAHQ